MLLSDWYPVYSGPCVFSLEVTLPRGFVVLSESNRMAVRPGPGEGMKTQTFDFPVAVSGITLVGGKHIVQEEIYRGVTLRTYFFAEEDHLSGMYRENVKRYVDLYEKMLGPYPFGAFSVVENIFQTGYSFPTYTLLGSRIIPSRYVPEISLGHEFLHQWFGHFVGVDGEGGNWSEGLTTYLADHWYEELEGKGHAYRKKILVDYMNYVPPTGDIPVSQFEGRVDFATKAVGYGKAAMIGLSR
jgi:aminopeptidase N